MSDSDSSCGVVIPGYQQPSVKMVKRDRHRELAYHHESYPCPEDSGGHLAMTHQHEMSPANASEHKPKSRDHGSSKRMGRRVTMDNNEPSARTKNTAFPKNVEISHIGRNNISDEIKATEDNNHQSRKIDSRDHASSKRMGRRSTMEHYEPLAKTKTTDFPKSVEISHIGRNNISNEIESTEDYNYQSRKSDSRDHASSKRMGRRATMDHYEPSARTKTTDFPKSVEISHIDGNNMANEIKSIEDNNYQSDSIRRRTIPSYSEEYKYFQIDHRASQNIDSKSLGIHRTVQSKSNRNEHNKNSRVVHQQHSEPVLGNQRSTSRDITPDRSRKTKRDPNIPSFLSIPINHENMDDYEGCDQDLSHLGEDNLKDPLAQGSSKLSTSDNCSVQSIGVIIKPPQVPQAPADSNARNLAVEHPSPLMVAASELDAMRNQLNLYLHRMSTTHNSEQSVVKVNILSPPTPLPYNCFPRQLLEMVRLLPGNDQCCDCGKYYSQGDKAEKMMKELKMNFECAHIGEEGLFGTQQSESNNERLHLWASVSYGIILCTECAYRHYRKSKKGDHKMDGGNMIKSLNGRDWTLPDVIAMLEGGNSTIIQYFSYNRSEDKTYEVVPAHPDCKKNGLLGSAWVVAKLEEEVEEVKMRNPDVKEKAFDCEFDIRYTSAVAVSYSKLLSNRVLAFGSKWQLWM